MTNYEPLGRVLVIDDDDVARLAVVELLKSAGYDVFDLPSAIGATRRITEYAIDTVAVDVMMPTLSGDKFTRLLRGSVKHADLTIILVSGRPTSELQVLAACAGADAVVSKSEVRKDLVPTMRRARYRRAQARRLANSEPRG